MKAACKLQLELLVQTSRTEAIQSLLENMVNIQQNDLVYQFLKALKKQVSVLKHAQGTGPRFYQTVAHYLLHAIVKKDLRRAISTGMPDPDLAAPW